MDGRARTAGPLSKCLAAWVVLVLTLAPLARPLPANLAPTRAAAAPEFTLARDRGAPSKPPASRLLPSQPSDLGVLARWSWIETKLGLSPARPPFFPTGVVDQPLRAPLVVGAHAAEPGDVFHRSSVGTARSPTGPPV